MMATLDQAEDFYQGKTSVSPEDSQTMKKSLRSSLNSVSPRSSVSLTSLQNKYSKDFDVIRTESNAFSFVLCRNSDWDDAKTRTVYRKLKVGLLINMSVFF